ncbi:hypothetical protein AALP_AA5G263800 [Arabis alpina]|uniref:Knottin scorpion toxin-like domain-containing protein n=1 Tax=Arabis alpina TaxID=50452 RepID=A0A087GZH3_ARAAL|nr:hypothetical protein AALP_AA5G263800 [Arabis alpina]
MAKVEKLVSFFIMCVIIIFMLDLTGIPQIKAQNHCAREELKEMTPMCLKSNGNLLCNQECRKKKKKKGGECRQVMQANVMKLRCVCKECYRKGILVPP